MINDDNDTETDDDDDALSDLNQWPFFIKVVNSEVFGVPQQLMKFQGAKPMQLLHCRN